MRDVIGISCGILFSASGENHIKHRINILTEFNICHETSTEFQIKSIKIVCLLTAVFTQSSLMDLLLKILKQMSGNKLLCVHVHQSLFPLKYSYGLIRELL